MLTVSQLSPPVQTLYQAYLAKRAEAARLDEEAAKIPDGDMEGFADAMRIALDAVQLRRWAADTFAAAFTSHHLRDEDDK